MSVTTIGSDTVARQRLAQKHDFEFFARPSLEAPHMASRRVLPISGDPRLRTRFSPACAPSSRARRRAPRLSSPRSPTGRSLTHRTQGGIHAARAGRPGDAEPPQRLQGRLHGRRHRRRRRAAPLSARRPRSRRPALVFLDLPAPWDAVPHAKAALRVRPAPSPPAARGCC